MHVHPRPGGAYGKVNLDIPGTQPERDLLCGHIFPDHFALASYLIVHPYEHIFPLLAWHTVSEVGSLASLFGGTHAIEKNHCITTS